METVRPSRSSGCSWCPRYRERWRAWAPPASCCLLRESRKARCDRVTSEAGDPAFGRGKQTDHGEVRIGSHVEPVAHAGGHADQIIALAQHHMHLCFGMQVEHAGALDE